MKVSTTIQTAFFLLFAYSSNAQQRVALQSAGVTTIYSSINPFIAAYTNAVQGDTIYLSGGGFTSPATLDKGITILGAGFHLDSTTATYPTIISNSIILGPNADYLYAEGITFQNITRYSTDTANQLSFVRCRILSFSSANNGPGESMGFAFVQNVIGNMDLNGIISSAISNNIITGHFNSSSNNLISNNLFKHSGGYYNDVIAAANNNTFSNNVFFHNSTNYFVSSSVGNIFENNVIAYSSPVFGTTPIDNNNYKGIDLTNVFVNQSGVTFEYTHDYHLQATALSTYLGNDGSQVGVYGGVFPMKVAMVPQNPHISTKLISPQTTPSGDLNIQIKVNAQN